MRLSSRAPHASSRSTKPSATYRRHRANHHPDPNPLHFSGISVILPDSSRSARGDRADFPTVASGPSMPNRIVAATDGTGVTSAGRFVETHSGNAGCLAIAPCRLARINRTRIFRLCFLGASRTLKTSSLIGAGSRAVVDRAMRLTANLAWDSRKRHTAEGRPGLVDPRCYEQRGAIPVTGIERQT